MMESLLGDGHRSTHCVTTRLVGTVPRSHVARVSLAGCCAFGALGAIALTPVTLWSLLGVVVFLAGFAAILASFLRPRAKGRPNGGE
jgi:hypothetical protein